MMKSPLRLPKEPHVFMENWLERVASGDCRDEDGSTWAEDGGRPALRIGYCVRTDVLPPRIVDQLMTAAESRAHGRMVFQIYEEMVRA